MGRLKSTSDASTQTEVTSTQEQGTWVNESYNATLVSELEMKEWELGEMFERLKDWKETMKTWSNVRGDWTISWAR